MRIMMGIAAVLAVVVGIIWVRPDLAVQNLGFDPFVEVRGRPIAPQIGGDNGVGRATTKDIQRIAARLVAESYLPPRDRAAALPGQGQWLSAWARNLGKQCPEASDNQLVLWLLNKGAATVPSLYAEGTFQPELAAQMARRLGKLPEDYVNEWQAIYLTKYEKEEAQKLPSWLSRLETVHVLVQVQSLWKGDEFVLENRQSILSRLQSITPGALTAWNQWYGSMTHADVAAQLLNVPELFDKDRFNMPLFREVAKVAITLWPDKRALDAPASPEPN